MRKNTGFKMNAGGIKLFFWRRLSVLISLFIVAVVGVLLWGYRGPGRVWFNFYATCIIYEIFWSLAVFFFYFQSRRATRIAVCVFTATCIIEILQLWHPAFLTAIRKTFLGMALIGTCFMWWQFAHYALGSFIGAGTKKAGFANLSESGFGGG